LLPSPVVSLPVGDTNFPIPSTTTHGSAEGSSVFARQSVLQLAPPGWNPLAHVITHCAAGHVGAPFPEGGAAHVFVQVPQ
jgi:hypothetical protein